jgi:DNA-binding FrmR family transcriptional regulator
LPNTSKSRKGGKIGVVDQSRIEATTKYTMAKIQETDVKEAVQQRLRRIEGQVRGVHKMVEDERECQEVLQQLNAILAAVRTTADLYVRAYAKDCLLNIDETEVRERELMVDRLVDLLVKARA